MSDRTAQDEALQSECEDLKRQNDRLRKACEAQMELLNRIYSNAVNGVTMSTSRICKDIVEVTTKAHEAIIQ